MRRYLKHGQTKELDKPDHADQVLIDKQELDALETKLVNKTNEADRWRKRITGEDLDYKIITVDYIRGNEVRHASGVSQEPATVYISIALPIPFLFTKEIKDRAKLLVERVFSEYISEKRKYKLHYAPKSGWSVNLQLTEEELDTFQLPN